MGAILGLLNVYGMVLTPVLRLGRQLAWVCIGLMTLIILAQVFFRYIVGSALPWPDEAARFLMLWMTAFIAPSAYRWGGFVSIDLLSDFLPKRVAALLALFFLVVSLVVLVVAAQFGWKHVNSGWLFASSTLRVPMDLIGGKAFKIKLAWMYMSLFLTMVLMAIVNVELILKAVAKFIDPQADVPDDPDAGFIGAE